MPRKRIILMLSILLLVLPTALVLYTLFDNRNYGLISLVMVFLALIPFLMRYEMKKPPAREWIPIVTMAAIAAVGRFAFAPLPHFKPVSAIIIVTAMVFGAEAGFLTGALAALASNLFFGQGPWTPWQMFAWGMIGFLAGALAKHGFLKKKWQICLYGATTGYLYGWILNIWAASTMMMAEMSWQAFLSLYVSSFVLDSVHSISTVIFLLLIAGSWGAKLRRVQLKFGILCEANVKGPLTRN
ncbi:MAG: ECF transporter S component [Oscillospiraceae bacterium]